jgi:hypothetical protein
MTSFVRIALAGAGSFAEMEIRAGDDIADLAERACANFSHWGANAGQIFLYLVAAGDDEEPVEEARCCRVVVGYAWAGPSRALGFPRARGWWRGKPRTAVRNKRASRSFFFALF